MPEPTQWTIRLKKFLNERPDIKKKRWVAQGAFSKYEIQMIELLEEERGEVFIGYVGGGDLNDIGIWESVPE